MDTSLYQVYLSILKAELVPATPLNSFEDQNEGISFLRLHYTVPSQKEDNIFSVSLKPLK